jgi:hypothetical protein
MVPSSLFLWRFVMRVTIFSGAMLMSSLGMGMAGTARATVYPSPVTAFETTDSSKDIVLSEAMPIWNADLSSYSSFIADVHDVLGYYGGSNSGQADLLFQEGNVDETYGEVPFAPYVMVGSQADAKSGNVVYKFVIPAGFKTGSGGTITTDLYFKGTPSESAGEWIGVSTSLSVEEPSLNSIVNGNDFTKQTMSGLFTGAYGNFSLDSVTLSIPSDATQFYVAIVDNFTNGRLAIGSLNVSANFVAVPEPAELSVLVVGGVACVRRRRR